MSWISTALGPRAREGLAAYGFTTRTGSARRVARLAASRVACRRAGLVKVVARLEPLYWTTDSGMNPAPSTVRRAPALPRIPAFGVMNERTGTGTVTVNATGPDAALPSGVTTGNARGPVGADGSMVIRAGTFVAVPPGWTAPATPVPAKLTDVAPARLAPPIEALTAEPRAPWSGVIDAIEGGGLTVRGWS